MTVLDWVKQLLEELDVSAGIELLVPAAIFAISVAFFGFVIFNLHRSMSRRDVFVVDISGLRKSGRPLLILAYGLVYAAMYGLMFPFLAYVWFWLLVVMLAFLYSGKEAQELLLIGMAVLTSVRVTAYYNEDLSKDISKILPYGLLGIFLVNLGRFDLQASINLLESMGAEEDTAFYYWAYTSTQELVLRATQPFVSATFNYVKILVSNQTRGVSNRLEVYSNATAAFSENSPGIANEAVKPTIDAPAVHHTEGASDEASPPQRVSNKSPEIVRGELVEP